MNKTLFLLLLTVAFIAIKSEFKMCDQHSFSEEETLLYDDRETYCMLLSTSEDHTHCCYMELDDYQICKEITDDAYENIKRYKKFLRNTYSHVKIKCASEFLTYSLLGLLVLLF